MQVVPTADETDVWKDVTIEMMFDEEAGTSEGVSGWISSQPKGRRPVCRTSVKTGSKSEVHSSTS